MRIRTFPRKGDLDFGRYCGLWVSQWLTPKLRLRHKWASLRYAVAWLVFGRNPR